MPVIILILLPRVRMEFTFPTRGKAEMCIKKLSYPLFGENSVHSAHSYAHIGDNFVYNLGIAVHCAL